MTEKKALQTYYDILKVNPAATDDEIAHAYRNLAKIYHPDQNKTRRHLAETRLKMINEAYAALKTDESRNQYNKQLRDRENTQQMRLNAGNDNANISGFWGNIAQIFWPDKNIKKGHFHV
ncbi:MAG: DnaJ domain-containing protein [Alphaproteobacteria bacterium]|nr:DnaJ domain-containing protein [Alphaproteobacteria bacterium]